MPRGRRRERVADGSAGLYMISAVAQKYDIHPQTLRLYEREGLLKPSRTDGNTRLYSDEDLKQLEVILNLTREGRREFKPEKIDVRELIETIVATVAHQAAEADAQIRVLARERGQQRLQWQRRQATPAPVAQAVMRAMLAGHG